MGRESWTPEENDVIVAAYLGMLEREIKGEPYSKAERIRAILPLLSGRTLKSVEFKFRNVSAVLIRLGLMWIWGYKPAANFQLSLVEAVGRWLTANEPFVLAAEIRPEALPPRSGIETGHPPETSAPLARELEGIVRIARNLDFAARDERNTALGLAGERCALEHERSVLTAAGRKDLARKVRWVSQEDGDGAGYDIASFAPDESERLIEVKTTNGWERTPFYVSPNELRVAQERGAQWRILRIWNFAARPSAFELRPPLEPQVLLTPTNYRASFG